MAQDRIGETIKDDTYVDPTGFERNREVVEHFKELGIPWGGYRLEPAFGGQVTKVPNIPIE